ncbi:glycosyltransferase family 2 protein [Candidatus Margulisiibacteriota bacterium]
MTELSIIIISYKNISVLEQCLRSIYKNETALKNPELIVIDNNSADGTVEFLQQNFPKITLIVNPDNKGFASANNQGLRIARGKKVLLLNNDTIVLDNALSKMAAYLDSHPEIGLLGPKLLNEDGSIQAQGSILGPHFWNSPQPKETSFLRGAALMTTQKAISKVGLLDENFFFYNEDIDYCRRMLKAGYKVVYYPEAEITHYGGKTSFKRQLMGLQGTLYLWKKMVFKSLVDSR